MQIGTKGRYAVKAMACLGELLKYASVIPLSIVSEKEGISLIYLEQLFSKLRVAGLVKSVRGKKGGYSFSKLAEEISVADIVCAVEDNLFFTQCNPETETRCDSYAGVKCRTHQLWDSTTKHLISYLKEILLSSLMQRTGEPN